MLGLQLDLTPWTTACTDNGLMNHLLNLFRTHNNIIRRVFFRFLFGEDLCAGPGNIGSRSFCSLFLVIVLLAISYVSEHMHHIFFLLI